MSRFIDAPNTVRCEATIRLSDNTTAQCGRRQAEGSKFCWQHQKKRD